MRHSNVVAVAGLMLLEVRSNPTHWNIDKASGAGSPKVLFQQREVVRADRAIAVKVCAGDQPVRRTGAGLPECGLEYGEVRRRDPVVVVRVPRGEDSEIPRGRAVQGKSHLPSDH